MAKIPKFGAISKQLQTLITNISGTDKAIDKLETVLSTTIPPVFNKKLDELWSTNHRVYAANDVYPPRISSVHVFGRLYTSIANISGSDQAINKRQTVLSTTVLSTFDEGTGELWSTNEKVYAADA